VSSAIWWICHTARMGNASATSERSMYREGVGTRSSASSDNSILAPVRPLAFWSSDDSDAIVKQAFHVDVVLVSVT